MKNTSITLVFLLLSSLSFAGQKLINGYPAGDLFPAVGMINSSCTITKVGPRQFLTAAHCLNGSLPLFIFSNSRGNARLTVKSVFIHPSWIKDCSKKRCDGTEVGSDRMTPGRSDVAMITTKDESPSVAITAINFDALDEGTEVAMVGAGCTRRVEPGGQSKMRYGMTKLVSAQNLNHLHSLYKDIAEITGQSDWVTTGYGVDKKALSLCPGDSGGPLMTKNQDGVWEIVGIAADYTFNGRYKDGDETVTNLHTRLDDDSLNRIGEWIRSNWDK